MLQEAIDLQQNAVAELSRKIGIKNELTFRAPTGSGKTHMMADFMNRMLGRHPDLVFLVSTLSKGNLAEQNYKVFKNCANNSIFPNLNPHLISSDVSDEERLFIPEGFNVYVLPRDLYKDKSKLKDEGALVNFLETLTTIKEGARKNIWLIRDECHQKTSNLDDIAPSFFEKVINFSATPKLSRGQIPDVEITDEAAMNAKLIKRVELDNENELLDREKGHHPETALRKFKEIKEKYRILLGVNPCLIIQISNKDKAEEEWKVIESWLNKPEFKDLKWMSIVDKKEKCRTNDAIGKLPVECWKDWAKEGKTIDVIVFKMVISEGWDIPRACMLYQVRDTQSKQLDEQVMGRVRRNPRLLDFETLSSEAQNLATTAWVWGIEPENDKKSRQVKLFGERTGIPSEVRIKTTRLKPLTERKDFDIAKFISEKSKNDVTSSSNIFDLYAKLQRSENEVRDLCYSYANNVAKWFRFCKHIEAVRKEYDTFVCDYAKSMEIVKDENGKAKEVSFPLTSLYVDNEHYQNIGNWVWQRKDGSDKFSFDSEAEREWASILKDLSRDYTEPFADDKCFLWGKNFITNSEIKFEYYLNGIHSSYPDFVMKDRQGYIHLFEVKSVNVSNAAQFDSVEYKIKVNALKRCYLQCSILTDHAFYLPILEDESWQIIRFLKGKEDPLSKDEFIDSLRKVAAMRYDDK